MEVKYNMQVVQKHKDQDHIWWNGLCYYRQQLIPVAIGGRLGSVLHIVLALDFRPSPSLVFHRTPNSQ